VLNIDKDNRRISLGLKQTQENPWPRLSETYAPGTAVEGKVVRVIDRGVVVDLGNDVEGFVPLSQLGGETKAEGEVMKLRVTKVDGPNQRIVLGVENAPAGAAEDVDEDYVEENTTTYSERYAGSGSSSIGEHLDRQRSDESEES